MVPTSRWRAFTSITLVALLGGLTTFPAHADENASDAPTFTLPALADGSVKNESLGLGLSRLSEASGTTQGLAVLTSDSGNDRALASLEFLTGSTSETPAMWAATDSYVDLSWQPPVGATRFLVYQGNTLLGITTNHAFRDSVVVPGETANYRIESLFADQQQSGGIWGLVVTVPSSSDHSGLSETARTVAAKAASYKSATIQHQTFIPQSKIGAPPFGCTYSGSGYKYGGDGRGYGASAYPYRTRVQATVGFTGNGTVTTTKKVGATKVYSAKSGKLLDTKTASSSGIAAKRMAASTGTSVDVRFEIEASNPFCSGIPNSIGAVFSINVKKSGSWYIFSGHHKQMPSHELYIHSNSGGWVTAYRRKYYGVECLVSFACPYAQMSGNVGTY